MLNILKLYGVTLAAFFAIDMLWLGWIARGFYRKHLGLHCKKLNFNNQ